MNSHRMQLRNFEEKINKQKTKKNKEKPKKIKKKNTFEW